MIHNHKQLARGVFGSSDVERQRSGTAAVLAVAAAMPYRQPLGKIPDGPAGQREKDSGPSNCYYPNRRPRHPPPPDQTARRGDPRTPLTILHLFRGGPPTIDRFLAGLLVAPLIAEHHPCPMQ